MQLSSRSLTFLSLLTIGGCSQLIGLSDYEVDPKLDHIQGGQGGEPQANEGGEAPSKGGSSGGKSQGGSTQGGKSTGGSASLGGEGGEPPIIGGSTAGGEGGAPPVNPGTLVACDSAACCTQKGGTPVGVEMLKDGGFELGTVADGATPWTEDSTKGYALITDGVEEKADPHKGTYFIFLAGVTNEQSDVQSERLKFPADSGWIVLSGYRFFQLDSEATDTLNTDFMGIGLYSYTDDNPLELPFFWDNTDPGASVNYVKFSAEFSAEPHAGQDRYLLLRGSTDDYGTDADLTASNYMLDDISLKMFRCYK
ncbi:MAG TPA: hypothetical protein VHB79_07285 [Polyangiaceae bacterium]|nr:hypothetical protein [Polyangiaceae bacterium]